MCGIAGFVNLDGAPADHRVLDAMSGALRHRGPDDRGRLLVSLRQGQLAANGRPADAALAVERLRILDVSDRARQPMLNEAGTVAIAFNGAVTNAFAYDDTLQDAGVRFRSASDTERLLYLYEHFGLQGLLDRIDGMFALAIVDLQTRRLHLVRDHFGIKPLYWAQIGSTVLFASEAKAFLAHPRFRAEIDEQYVDEQLAFRYVAGDASLLKGVRQLRPAHCLTVSPDGTVNARYWSIPESRTEQPVSRRDAIDQLDGLLRRSVADHLRSDVEVGCQLSGGVDSSLVTLFAAARAGAGMRAFSLVFEDPKFSEAAWITEAAVAANVASHQYLFDEPTFRESLERATWHSDQPISHPNAVGLWHLAMRSREYVTVLLCGEGADEVFGGYARCAEANRLAPDAYVRATQLHPSAKLARLRPGGDLSGAYERRAAIFDEGRGDHLSNCLKYEMQTYLVDLLARQDKMMMSHGIENRVPFLDRSLVEFARALPAAHLVDDGDGDAGATKIIVKHLARRVFTDAFANRPKAAFNLPLSQYFRSAAFTAMMEDEVLPGMRRRGLVDAGAVRRLWRRSLSAPALTEPLWTPIALELWAQRFVDAGQA